MTPAEYQTLTDSIRSLSEVIDDVRKTLDSKLDKMEDREIARIKDLYKHIDDKIDKMVSQELFDSLKENTNQRINFIWRVFFWAVGPIFAAVIGLIFQVFAS